MKNKLAIISNIKETKLVEVDLPELLPNEVLIQNKCCSICTSDYQLWSGARTGKPLNVAFGHENSGIIVKVGSNVSIFKVGDRVAPGVIGCGKCGPCRKGKNIQLCENNTSVHVAVAKDGYVGPHGASTYKITEEHKLLKLKDTTSYSDACFLEPIATVVEGIERLRLSVGENILIYGAGTMGNLNAQVARAYGANVIIVEQSNKKIDVLKEMGFEFIINSKKENVKERINEILKGDVLDCISLCVASTSVYKDAFEFAPKCCRILMFSANYPEPNWGVDITPNLVHYKLWEIIGTYTATNFAFQKAMDFINSKALNLELLKEKSFKQENVQEAFIEANKYDKYRVLIDLEE